MKPNSLKTSAALPTRLTSKLALMLLALPACGAFAAVPDYSSTLTNATTLGTNTVTDATLAASLVEKAGTASDLNTNYVGWSVTPTQAVNLYFTGSAVSTTSGGLSTLSLGGAATATATASSSYNKLTVADYVNFSVGGLNIGVGALNGTGDNASLVNATKLANGNVLEISGAAYSAFDAEVVPTTLTVHNAFALGVYGNSNSVSITSGAHISASGPLYVGISNIDNPASGCNNSILISGKVTASFVGATADDYSASTLTSFGAIIGNFGSSNTLTLSDSGVLNLLMSNFAIGYYGDNNKVSATDSSIVVPNGVLIGQMPAASGNEVSLVNSKLSGPSDSTAGLVYLGKYGSSNQLTVNKSTMTLIALSIGHGDDSSADTDAATEDGTKGVVASEGCNNVFSATDSTITLAAPLYVGYFGSGNAATFKGTKLYQSWADTIQPGASAVDKVIQLNELTGINCLFVGEGYESDDTFDGRAFGSNNSLTFSDSSMFAVSGVMIVGAFGNGNSLTMSGGSTGIGQNVFYIGNGNSDSSLQGSSNTVTLTGAGTALTTALLSLGSSGSNNRLTVSNGASFTTGAILSLGSGHGSDSTKDNSAFGSNNVITVTGTGSSFASTSTNPVIIGSCGSNNQFIVADGASVSLGSSIIFLGSYGEAFGTVLSPNNVFSQGNKLVVSGGAQFKTAGNIIVGADGINNTMEVTGKNTVADVSNGTVYVGDSEMDGTLFGSNNAVTVSDDAVLLVKSLSIGGDSASYSSNNTVTVDSGAIVVIDRYFTINSDNGDHNYLRMNNGKVALKGKGPHTSVTWTDYIINGNYMIAGSYDGNGTSLIDSGAIQVWDSATSKYVTATKSDVSLTYYASETEAIAGTGYAGLAGYTVLSVATKPFAWAGDVYDAGSNVYCSSWYGWFYNDATYGDWVMSYNDYAWQYVSPDSTPDNTYLYDAKLGAWLYTNQTYFQNKWVYNYATGAWQKLGE
jgi:hypothetical protein